MISGVKPTEGAGAGRVFVFTKTDAGWDETDELKGPDSIAGDAFGYSGRCVGHHGRRRCPVPRLGYGPSVRVHQDQRWVGTRPSWTAPAL